jgi:hypothetical protein
MDIPHPSPSLNEVIHLLLSAEIRRITLGPEKAWLLHTKYNVKPCHIFSLKICSKSAFYRALKAKRVHRDIHIWGHPPNLNAEDSDALVQIMQMHALEQKHLTAEQILDQVSF